MREIENIIPQEDRMISYRVEFSQQLSINLIEIVEIKVNHFDF